jgi:hypothetical protein
MSRYVVHLVHRNEDDAWHLERAGNALGTFETKIDAENAGKSKCKAVYERRMNSQLIVHRKDGSIETEYTYGHDPESSPG